MTLADTLPLEVVERSSEGAFEEQDPVLPLRPFARRRAERDALVPHPPPKLTRIEFPSAHEVTLGEARMFAKRAISLYESTIIDTQELGPWVVVHGMLGLGIDLLVQHPDFNYGKPMRGLDWLSRGANYKQRPAFITTPVGARGQIFTPHLKINPGAMEGHPNQFIGYLSELGVPLNTPWLSWDAKNRVWKDHTLKAVLDDAKSQAGINPYPGSVLEHTWTLWALANYGSWDEVWLNDRGESWSIEKLLKFELNQGILQDTSCGGHHRVYAIYRALVQYQVSNPQTRLSGTYRRAHDFVASKIKLIQDWQNADGSFSSGNYLSSSMAHDWKSRLAADGHTLEVLVGVSSQETLQETWLLKGVYIVASDLMETRAHTLSAPSSSWGSTYHALHALRIFLERTEGIELLVE